MQKWLLLLTVAVLALSLNQTNAQDSMTGYELWNKVLGQFVDKEGKVDYESLRKNPGDFFAFISTLETADLTPLDDQQKKAFWINAYNAITMKLIVENYPVRDIRFVNFGFVWKIKRQVAGGKHSLGDIEHDYLRKLGDPRIHFAINCASVGCPRLPKHAFLPETLDEQLDHEARRFINDPEKVRLDRGRGILYHSAILHWFREDFLAVSPGIKEYIMRYIDASDREYLETHDVRLKVLPYDWGLNKQ